jgi:peptidoglycan/xylan/chitin deacetylase (PgdA/CDA1 family)/Tfp pilus assembly protein PilF
VILRFCKSLTLAALFFVLATACLPTAVLAASRTYAENLSLAVAGMEQGKHPSSLVPIRNALGTDRNEPLGLIALGVLYLHADSPAAAAEEFRRASALAPGEVLAEWGAALADLAQGKGDAALFRSLNGRNSGQIIPADILSDATLLSLYTRLIDGDARGVRRETESVNADEANVLRLEIAAFAALRGGDTERGANLLTSLLKRPSMRVLAEDSALALTFDTDKPAEGEAPGLPNKLQFPPPPKSSATLSGRVTLSPPLDIPGSTAFVSYSVDGGSYSATTNNAPFSLDWNTARLPNGVYTLRTIVFDDSQHILRQTARTVTLANRDAPLSPAYLTGEQRTQMRARLWALLTPRPCRKAAHFALAERAVEVGDSDAALSRMESVCAIDPQFRGAYLSLRRFFREVLGPREGIWQARTTEKLVALTFDDGPNPLAYRTPALLDALKKADAPSTFFVVGYRAEECPDLLKRMIQEGHEIANHSYTHPNLTTLSRVDVERELCRTSVAVRDATGRRPRFYRPPGGNFNTAVVEAAEALGMSGAYWTVDGVKTEQKVGATPEELTRFVSSRIRPGAIVLLHNAPTITIEAVPMLVKALRAKGYKLVTMTELVQRTTRRMTPPTPNPTPTPAAAARAK